MTFRTLFSAALAAILATAVPAAAATYTINYTDTDTPLNGTLHLTTDDALNSYGGYTVTGISGTIGSDPITSLILADGSDPCGCFPEGFGALGGLMSLTNTLYLTTTDLGGGLLFDHGGLGFQSAATYYNLWGTDDGSYELDSWDTNFTMDPDSGLPTGFAVSQGDAAAVPEPASWAMFIGGFGLIGGALRRRAKPAPLFA